MKAKQVMGAVLAAMMLLGAAGCGSSEKKGGGQQTGCGRRQYYRFRFFGPVALDEGRSRQIQSKE